MRAPFSHRQAASVIISVVLLWQTLRLPWDLPVNLCRLAPFHQSTLSSELCVCSEIALLKVKILVFDTSTVWYYSSVMLSACVINVCDVLTVLQPASSRFTEFSEFHFTPPPPVCILTRPQWRGVNCCSVLNVGLYRCRNTFLNVIIQLWVIWLTDLSCSCYSKCNTLWLHCILV